MSLVSIGAFSKMTYLSVKALRHYHDVGLLEPADTDPATGYRLYSTAQVPTAQAIRRFRDLDMPIDDVRAVLRAPDLRTRNDAILAHLERMRQQLERTQTTVSSLQTLLEGVPAAATVEYRTLPATYALAITDDIGFDDAAQWSESAFSSLHAALGDALPAGPDGALYFSDFFEDGAGKVTAFVPIGEAIESGPADVVALPAVDVAVMVHDGSFADLDKTYGALGTIVAERGIGGDGPIREHYFDNPERTEVCWPITATPSRPD